MKIMLAVLLTIISCTATAEVYKWTDKHGVVHYEDQQPEKSDKIPAAKVEMLELSPITILDDGSVNNTNKENESWYAQWLDRAEELKTDILQRINEWRGATPVVSNESIVNNQKIDTRQSSAANQSNTVEIYTAAWCGACKKAKRWLNDRGVAYKDYDVEKDSNAALRMRKLGGGNGVPFAVINGKTFEGFNPAGYQAALH